MAVGDATELEPYGVYLAVRDALHAGTSLRAMDDDLLGSRTAPSSITHRRFRLNPARLDFVPKSRARPGDAVAVTERVVVLLAHDLDPHAHESSYQLAAADFVACLRALLTRTELSGLGQPAGGNRVIRRVAHTIEQEFLLDLTYWITLPEAS